jgi:hypothetical protein
MGAVDVICALGSKPIGLTGRNRPRPCENSAKFCKRSSRAKIFVIFPILNALGVVPQEVVPGWIDSADWRH